MGSSLDLHVGMGLALLGSNLCLLLLVLNALDWVDFLHADLTPLEEFAATTLSPWQLHIQSAAAGWILLVLSFALMSSPSSDREAGRKSSGRSAYRSIAIALGMAATLALPRVLVPYRQYHPIIRRSLVGAVDTDPPTPGVGEEGGRANSAEAAPNELVFTVDKMTCGGCGSHVRNLVEKKLASQNLAFDKVQVDWRAGVLSIYGGAGLADLLDKDGVVASVLEEDGYPTSFLYVQ